MNDKSDEDKKFIPIIKKLSFTDNNDWYTVTSGKDLGTRRQVPKRRKFKKRNQSKQND